MSIEEGAADEPGITIDECTYGQIRELAGELVTLRSAERVRTRAFWIGVWVGVGISFGSLLLAATCVAAAVLIS